MSVFRTDPTLFQIPEELLSRRLRWPSEIVSGSTCNALVPVHKCLIYCKVTIDDLKHDACFCPR